MGAWLYDGQLAIEFSKEVPPYSTIRFLRGGQRGKRRDSIERRGVFDTQGGLALGHLKHERGRASLGHKRGGDLGGIGADRDYAEPTAESTPFSGRRCNRPGVRGHKWPSDMAGGDEIPGLSLTCSPAKEA